MAITLGSGDKLEKMAGSDLGVTDYCSSNDLLNKWAGQLIFSHLSLRPMMLPAILLSGSAGLRFIPACKASTYAVKGRNRFTRILDQEFIDIYIMPLGDSMMSNA